MDAMPDATMPGTGASQSNGKRATITKGAMLTAGRKVAERITVEKMQQSFPSFYDQHADFFSALTNETVKLLTHSFQHAWLGLSTKGTFSHFVPLANALDRIESEAEARLNSGEEPLDLCSKGMNPTLTIPAQTLSALQKERNELRAIRQELQQQREAKVARCLKRAREADEKEARVRKAIHVMNQADDLLKPLDRQEYFNLLVQFREDDRQ